ncbi:hypothetical protein CJ030_MR6G010292 [Morella rubra]|uniref:Uncharacterized protein n=1 Tax=Morella rubra TaxID=262757 RepID=A0A6A1VFL2_9ROSI|nr:hypothetical protein CJ030_MR6G010292 [Morella rubra]
MRLDQVKRHGLLLGFLGLAALLLASSLFITGEKMEKLTSARNGEELFRAVALKQRKLWPYEAVKLGRKRPPQHRPAQRPPPAPRGSKGPHP